MKLLITEEININESKEVWKRKKTDFKLIFAEDSVFDILFDFVHDSQHGDVGLAGSSRGTDQHIFIGPVRSFKNNTLNSIKKKIIFKIFTNFDKKKPKIFTTKLKVSIKTQNFYKFLQKTQNFYKKPKIFYKKPKIFTKKNPNFGKNLKNCYKKTWNLNNTLNFK